MKNKFTITLASVAALVVFLVAVSQAQADTLAPTVTSSTGVTLNKSAKMARVFIVSPVDGATVTNPVNVKFGVESMTLAPAGTTTPGTGHHHLLVDADKLPALDQPIPSDEHHMHFGKAQTETALTLAPGKHTLQLLFGDGNHVPHSPAVVSQKITITVK